MVLKTTNFNLRHFPASLHLRLKKFAKKEGRTMAWVILKAIEEYLDRHEGKGG